MFTDEMVLYAKSLELPDLMRRRNIELVPINGGSAFKCLCPFHEEKTPSLNLNFKDGIWQWHCFGCGAGGTNLDFIMKYENKDFKEAVQLLSCDRDSKPGKFPNIPLRTCTELNRSIKIEKPECSLEDRTRLLSMVSEYYHKTLLNGTGDKGRQYLEKRGLLDDELIKTFKIGFSDGRTESVFKEHRKEMLEKIEIFSKQYYDYFTNCIIFPVLEENGSTTDLYGRRVATYKERKNHLYNKGDHLGIFNISNVKDAETIILTEGIIDALSFYKAGFKNVTAIYGVSGLIEAHEKFFKNGTVKKLILAFDRDLAGMRCVKTIVETQGFASLQISMVDLPETVKDVNELFIKEGAEALKQAIEKAFIPSAEFIEGRINLYILLKLSQEKENSVAADGVCPVPAIAAPADSLPENLEKIRAALASESVGADAVRPAPALDIRPAIPALPVIIPQGDNSHLSRQAAQCSFIHESLIDFKSPFKFNGLDLIFNSTVLSYEIRSVAKLKNLDKLSFQIIATMNDLSYRDTVELSRTKHRKSFENEAAKVFNIQTAVIEKDLSAMINFIEADFKERKNKEPEGTKKAYKMTDAELAEALKFLKSKDLIKLIIDAISTLGYVGDDMNKLLMYMGGTSRILDKPLAILIRSMSSTGKSYLIRQICSLMPPEDVHMWTGGTKQALFYLPDDELKHKILAVDEKEGMKDAEYPIRSLLSEGRLSIAVPMKNPVTGKIVTEQIVKDGPIHYVDGSTDTRTNPENANRCFEIFLDESPEQTKRIQEEQNKSHTLEGMGKEIEKDSIRTLHRNAQRILKPIKVIIPYVNLIEFPTNWIRTRRDHDRFLTLIICVAILHQYQREKKELNGKPYIEANFRDFAIAHRIAKTVLFNTFQELEKPVSDLYLTIVAMVTAHAKEQGIAIQEYSFTRLTVRQWTNIPDHLIKRFMRVLTDLEYFEVKNHGNGSKNFYQLARIVTKKVELKGLTTPAELKRKMIENGICDEQTKKEV